MSLECCLDPDFYVELGDDLVTSIGTEFCTECKALIPCGTPHYCVWEWREGEFDEERVHLGKLPCCEECGDLALSFMELGYCWYYGDLRNDIAEMNRYEDS